jgi:hypothetical protein
MHGLISLYLGFLIYLVIFFRYHRRSAIARKITIVLGVKLLILTVLYFLFFAQKMTKEQRKESLEKIIINEK